MSIPSYGESTKLKFEFTTKCIGKAQIDIVLTDLNNYQIGDIYVETAVGFDVSVEAATSVIATNIIAATGITSLSAPGKSYNQMTGSTLRRSIIAVIATFMASILAVRLGVLRLIGVNRDDNDSHLKEIGYFPIAMSTSAQIDIVFLHGLGGGAKSTWKADGAEMSFQEMLAIDIQNANIWAVGYDSSPSAWIGESMELSDRAKNVLSNLAARSIGTDRPLYLLCHSLGGLVAKQMLETGLTLNDEELKIVAENIKGIVFFATPHRGSINADLLWQIQQIMKISRFSSSVEDLKVNSQKLLNLNEYFVREATRLGIDQKCLSFYETQKIFGILVVDRYSGDPGFATGSIARPAAANHLSICKPLNQNDDQYVLVRKSISQWIDSASVVKVEAEDFYRRWEKDNTSTELMQQIFLKKPHRMRGKLAIDTTQSSATIYVLYPPNHQEIPSGINWASLNKAEQDTFLEMKKRMGPVKVTSKVPVDLMPPRIGAYLEFEGDIVAINNYIGVIIANATIEIINPPTTDLVQ